MAEYPKYTRHVLETKFGNLFLKVIKARYELTSRFNKDDYKSHPEDLLLTVPKCERKVQVSQVCLLADSTNPLGFVVDRSGWAAMWLENGGEVEKKFRPVILEELRRAVQEWRRYHPVEVQEAFVCDVETEMVRLQKASEHSAEESKRYARESEAEAERLANEKSILENLRQDQEELRRTALK